MSTCYVQIDTKDIVQQTCFHARDCGTGNFVWRLTERSAIDPTTIDYPPTILPLLGTERREEMVASMVFETPSEEPSLKLSRLRSHPSIQLAHHPTYSTTTACPFLLISARTSTLLPPYWWSIDGQARPSPPLISRACCSPQLWPPPPRPAPPSAPPDTSSVESEEE